MLFNRKNFNIYFRIRETIQEKTMQMAKMVKGKKKIPLKDKIETLQAKRREFQTNYSMSFFKKHTLHIEVHRQDGKLEKVKIFENGNL